MPPAALEQLEQALHLLEEDLKSDLSEKWGIFFFLGGAACEIKEIPYLGWEIRICGVV